MSVVSTKHGEILLVEQTEKEHEARQVPSVVGSRQTIRQMQSNVPCQPPEEPDPWMQFLHKQGRTVRGQEGSRSGQAPSPAMLSEDAIAKKVKARVAASIATQVREQVGQATQTAQPMTGSPALSGRWSLCMMREMLDEQTLRLEELVAPKRRKDGAAHE